MELVRLGDIAEISSGGTPSRTQKNHYGGDILWAKISDVESAKNGFVVDTEEKITIEGLANIRNKIFKKGTLLFTMYGSIGKVAIAGKDLATNQAILGITPKGENTLHLPYLILWFKANKQKLINQGRGGTLQNLSATIIRDIEIELHSHADQIHIANILSKAETLIAQRKESIRLLDAFLKSTFLEMFGDNTTTNKNWKKISLVDGCSNKNDVKCGPFGTQLNKGEYQEKGIPVWGIPQINSEFKIPPKEYVTESKALELEEYSVVPFDIVMSRKGNVGKCSLFPKGFSKGIIHSDVLRIRTDRKKILPEFLLFQLKFSKHVEMQIRGVTTGAIMAGINVGLLKHIILHQPPIELQNQFAAIVSKIETLKKQYTASLRELENLFGVLSQKAFKGELTKAEQTANYAIKEMPLPIAAEPADEYKTPVSTIPDNRKGFAKQVLGGKIVSLFKDDANFTHIKFQKLQYLAEHFIEEDLLWNYYRQSAGPYDNKFMHTVAPSLKRNKWYEENNFKYYPLQKATEIDKYYKSYFGGKEEKLNKLFSLLEKATEKNCEAIATIYAVWNNHIILNKPFDQDEIKKEFFEWSTRKGEVFTESEFEKTLAWMQKHEIVPTGFGQLIKEKK